MRKKVAILQSNYIPWKGYFDIINMVDEFILYDDVQYTRRDWRNRNKIKTPKGAQWLTVPIAVKGKYIENVNQMKVTDDTWRAKHWKTIVFNYSKAKYFKEYKELFEALYMEDDERFLSQINFKFIKCVCDILGIETKLTWSTDFTMTVSEKTDKLVSLCTQAGATEYISGPAAKDYIETKLFTDANIELSYADYSGYPEYNQLFPPFEHAVSVIDLILNEGPDAAKYMKSFSYER